MPTPIERLTAALADHYRIEHELGAGGMATVYLAHDVRHDRRVGGNDDAAEPDVPLLGFDRRVEIGARLRSAVALGDVSDIQELARHLLKGDIADIAVGERINRLAAEFDFNGLSELADSLAT